MDTSGTDITCYVESVVSKLEAVFDLTEVGSISATRYC
jgi:hypothetical protein